MHRKGDGLLQLGKDKELLAILFIVTFGTLASIFIGWKVEAWGDEGLIHYTLLICPENWPRDICQKAIVTEQRDDDRHSLQDEMVFDFCHPEGCPDSDQEL